MESLWDVLPPELQEYILKKKTKLEQRDKKQTLVEEISEFISNAAYFKSVFCVLFTLSPWY